MANSTDRTIDQFRLSKVLFWQGSETYVNIIVDTTDEELLPILAPLYSCNRVSQLYLIDCFFRLYIPNLDQSIITCTGNELSPPPSRHINAVDNCPVPSMPSYDLASLCVECCNGLVCRAGKEVRP